MSSQTEVLVVRGFLIPSALCALFLLTQGLAWTQTNSPKTESSRNESNITTELDVLRQALSKAQTQLDSQQQQIEVLKQQLNSRQLDSFSISNEEQHKRMMFATTHATTPAVPLAADTDTDANVKMEPADEQAQQKGVEPESSLSSFKIGDAVITPGGFVDLENVFRTTNTQNNIATAFAAIPFSNTTAGHVTEFRSTAQFSRLNLKVTSSFGGNDVIGYVEGDFSGNDAASIYQSVNGHTNRLRLYFMDLKRGKWEFLGGQTWSWLTPNRNGLGPLPPDLAVTYNEDQNIGVGLPYTRAAEFRVAYHPNEHWALGLGIENPNQFTGNFVALPSAFASTLSPQFDNGNQIGAANSFPDVLSKVACDTKIAGKPFHAEVTGLVTGAHVSVMLDGGKSFQSHPTLGGGGQIATNYEFLRNVRFLANAFWSSGGSHYLLGTGPQVVVRPNGAGTDVSLSMVHSGAGSAGFEWNATKKTAFAVYYGADYFQRNFFPDTTNTSHPNTMIGYGGPGSPNTNNRTIQEATFDWVETFWKHPKYGALQLYTQYSYLTRAPWFVAPGTPKNAHLSMVYAGFRYVLPSTSGTLYRVPSPN